ncbi:12143_t:CDS:1 [Acaulospora morrowiae]|uniref:12143_t:CDS:1 n=1 Tax=Acaulospora morrowiae TaxID=94023 RepID=A0A9N9GZK0_9GLOM|nr:12143_t:CDS:1 [Acaulospora morrowiae]
MSKKNLLHYYPDGDILIIVEDTMFCLHRNIMALASKFFQDMFTCASASSDDNGSNLTGLTLEGESALTFENVLSHIYPNTYLPIDWKNVTEILRLADKYIMDSVVSAAKTFLEREFRKEPLCALYLADRYLFKDIYKEASKLVLETFPDYKIKSTFRELSIQTRNALTNRYLEYTDALGKLNKVDFTSGYLHCTECLNSINHNREINEKLVNKVRQIQVLPLPLPPISPSTTQKILFQSIGSTTCDNQFMIHQLSRKLQKHFGTFEPLECKKHKKEHKFYLFIELG